MKRADRLIQIIELMRRERRPVTAHYMAEELEVTTRTIYRDMVTLTASGVPIDGEAGIGYVMGNGYHLPPMMFTEDELEALMLGMRMVQERADKDLAKAAKNLIGKISASIPDDLSALFLNTDLYAPQFVKIKHEIVNVADIRHALRHQFKIEITYADVKDNLTTRIIWPILMAHFYDNRNLVAWCETRQAFRSFRTERLKKITVLEQKYKPYRKSLIKKWAIENQIPELA
ncbi:MAG: YafY family transcriptional regulator [Rhizobiales bacterium]|nr:YafY family transcriptional regulator [Hyphomicrobiales bacterium]